ncbi:MAG: glycoside hydrolase family 3 C-terminal domain-containing protein [Bacteroidales bacterium]|nr:glycoside hydrolase family 3 C-terminal domain-containing protein [Bacteroidales bacterium]
MVFARDEKHAGELSLIAGIDMDMQGAVFYNYLKESLEEGKVTLQQIDAAVKNVLKLKADLGLFDDPYRYLDEQREKETVLSEEHMEHALDAAKKSLVLLKNEPLEGEKILPLQNAKNKTIALIGPLGDNKEDMTGTWWASADIESIVTVKEGLEKRYPDVEIITVKGADTEGEDTSGFKEALKAAELADVVIMAIGENKLQSGEAASRTEIDLPGKQKDLVKAIHKTGKPIISVVFAGRPLAINWMEENIPAILYAWHPGTRAGDAVAEVLSGDYNPSAKLVTTFPRNTGQIPLYYNAKNTGRPFDADNKYTSKYLYTPNEPLYPFGYGLSYTDFEYSDIDISNKTLKPGGKLTATITLTNTGDVAGKEVVQCYIRDLVGSVTRPVKELKGFEMVELQPGESAEVSFTITPAMLKFYNQQMEYVAEEGDFKLFIGTSSENVREASFTYAE